MQNRNFTKLSRDGATICFYALLQLYLNLNTVDGPSLERVICYVASIIHSSFYMTENLESSIMSASRLKPCIQLPLSVDVLKESVDKAKDWALMHGKSFINNETM